MISLGDISKVLDLFKRLLELITKKQELTRKNFEEVVMPLFQELDQIVQSYHKLLWELDRDIRIATSHEDIAAALDKAVLTRNTFVMSRAKVMGELKGMLKYEDHGSSESYDRSLIVGEDGQLVWALAHSIKNLFASPLHKVYTYATLNFEEILETANIMDLEERKHKIGDTLKGSLNSLKDDWEMTCFNYASLLRRYKKI